MRVTIQIDKEPEKQAELFVIGQNLGLEIDKQMIRIALTPSQWELLAQSAGDRSARRGK